jgi:hypothetical protein
MSISSQLLERYVKSFAVAFPDYEERQRMASIAEVSGTAQVAGTALDAWRDILHCAHSAGTLPQLVGAAVALKPRNRALAKLHLILAGRAAEKTAIKKVVLVTFVCCLGALLLVWSDAIQIGSDPLDTSSEGSAFVEVLTEVVTEESPPQLVPDEIELPTLEHVETTAETSNSEVESTNQIVESGATSGRCSGEGGSIVGYFYVGDGIDALAGETHIMATSAYVRGDYPRRENGWDFSVAASCALNPGDRVILRDDPILVDGGKYWVALYGESLLSQ